MTLTWRRYYLLGLLFILIGPMAGCNALMNKIKVTFSEPPAVTEDSRFIDALALYRTGDYQGAQTLFSVLSNAETTSLQRQQARLGDVCCRLMMADSPEDMSLAMGPWEDLKIGEDANTWQMEKTLFEPLVIRWADSFEKPRPTVSGPSPDQKKMETELAALKKKAARVSELQRRLNEAMAENRTLKEKIKALEAIDQNIQKKKTEMSTSNE